MEIKYTIQGLLIYLAIAAYLSACLTKLLGLKKTPGFLFAAGFIVASIGYIYRWQHVGHVPMQNLFEVFLTLGVLIFPIWLFSKRFLGLSDDWTSATDMLLGVIVLFPAGFIFSAEPQQLPPVLQSILFAPHVAVYMLSYVFLAKAAFQALSQLITKQTPSAELAAYKMVCVGFPLLTMGLLLGSIWGKYAWGDYWGWDPKELWSLASWLVFVGYFHFRYMFKTRHPRLNSIWVIMGIVFIIITLLWVNLSRIFTGLHSYAT